MYDLPTSIMIGDTFYTIRQRGDYRMVLDVFSALNDIELTKQERVFAALIIFYEDLNSVEDINNLPDLETAIKEMFLFINCGQPEDEYGKHNYRLIDWDKDSLLVCSAVNKVAGKEIRAEEYVHWWTFMGYYMAIGECSLSTIVSIRYKILAGKKLESYERKFKNENPQYFNWKSKTIEQEEDDALIRQMWNSGGSIDGG